MKSVLEVSKLTKSYPPDRRGGQDYLAVDQISFSLKKAEILGLLGPNGAGKTTTIQMLLGLTKPTGGQIRYFGRDFDTNREYVLERINFASAYAEIQGKMTVKQNLTIYGLIYQVPNLKKKIEELAEILEIGHLLDTLYWKLSSGQQTRVILAKGLINDPKLLLMDEPTASLDPDIVQKIMELIRVLRKEKKVSVLYTSHNMEEITRLCDRVIFLHRGKILAVDTPLGLTKLVGEAKLALSFDGEKEKVKAYLNQEGWKYRFIRPQLLEVEVGEEDIPKALFGLKKQGIWVTNIDISKPTLEDVFLSFARKERV